MNKSEERQTKINQLQQLASIAEAMPNFEELKGKARKLIGRALDELMADTDMVKQVGPFPVGAEVGLSCKDGKHRVVGYSGEGQELCMVMHQCGEPAHLITIAIQDEGGFSGVSAWVEPVQAEEVVEQPKERDYPLPVKIPVKLNGLTYVLADYVDYNGTPDWMLLTSFKRGKPCATYVPPNLRHLVTQAY